MLTCIVLGHCLDACLTSHSVAPRLPRAHCLRTSEGHFAGLALLPLSLGSMTQSTFLTALLATRLYISGPCHPKTLDPEVSTIANVSHIRFLRTPSAPTAHRHSGNAGVSCSWRPAAGQSAVTEQPQICSEWFHALQSAVLSSYFTQPCLQACGAERPQGSCCGAYLAYKTVLPSISPATELHGGMKAGLIQARVTCPSRPAFIRCRCSQPFG